jgi:hypothetical protein
MKAGAREILMALLTVAPVALGAVAGLALEEGLPGAYDAEAAAIAASHGLVRRDGPVLSFVLATGAALALTDRLVCGDLPCPERATTRYRYTGWDAKAAGYRLQVGARLPVDMTLAWALAGDDPVLFNANALLVRKEKAMAMPAAPPPRKIDAGLADWLANTAGARDAIEAPRIAKSAGRVSRSGSALMLALDDGRKLALTDDLACGQLVCPPEVVIGFEYHGADPSGRFHAIEEHFYETGDALLFDARSGTVTSVAGPIAFSPDGNRAVAVMNDPEPRGSHDIEIWSLAGAAPALEFSYTGDGENTYEVTSWDDPDHIRLTRGKWRAEPRTPVMLAHVASGWHLQNGN